MEKVSGSKGQHYMHTAFLTFGPMRIVRTCDDVMFIELVELVILL